MQTILRSFFNTFTVLLCLVSFSLHAQITDTLVYDYNTNGGTSCLICGSNYDCFSSFSETVADNNAGRRLIGLKFKIFHTACGSGAYHAILNGDTVGTTNMNYLCTCNSCVIDSIDVPTSKLSSYVINGNNSIYLGNVSLCVDRILIIRSFILPIPDNAGVASLDSPKYHCAGSHNVVATVVNNGNTIIDSVLVNWTFNGVAQSVINYKTAIDTVGSTGGNKAVITLGNKSFTANKNDTISIWTSMPNGVADTFNNDDTLHTIIRTSKSGTFTVGGTSPDYTTITSALADLQQVGLCGPVTLNIRNGVYTEQIDIPAINNMSATNTLTIQSESGDSSLVTISYGSTNSSANYVVRVLPNVSHVTIKQITIDATGSSYARGIELTNNHHINLDRCKIIGKTGTSTSTNYACIYQQSSSGNQNSNLSIKGCRFENGSYGILIIGNVNQHNHLYQSNIFTNQYYTNIQVSNLKNLIIRDNLIEQLASAYGYGYGIRFYTVDSFDIHHNKIALLNGGTGIYCSGVTGSASTPAKIFNNFISCVSNNTNGVRAWSCYSSSYIDFLFNNTYTRSANTNYNSNVEISYGSDIRLFNNSIFEDGENKLIIQTYSGSNNISYSDRNNFFQQGKELFEINNKDINGLPSWTLFSKLDSNSSVSNPNYISITDLHARSSDMNARALVVSGVSTDIDGESRNATKPDIGADEFDLPPIDAGLYSILPIADDSVCVVSIVKNYGSDTLTSLTVNWTLNGVSQTAFNWTGTLVSNDSTSICLGYKKFLRDTTYNLKVWTSAPNSKADTFNKNDTILKVFKPALKGTYTIGGTTPDFANFTQAVNALNASGIIGNVLFKVRNGTYTESIEFGSITGVTGKNSIVFESESKDSSLVILSNFISYGTPYVIKFNSSKGITFRHITIQSTNTSQPSRVIYYTGSNQSIIFGHNHISNAIVNSTNSYYDVLVLQEDNDYDICYNNNYFNGGSSALRIYDDCEKLQFFNNKVENQHMRNLDLSEIIDSDIHDNHFTSNSTYSSFYGVYINTWSGPGQFYNNHIYGPNKDEVGGLYIYSQSIINATDTLYIFNNMISTGGNGTQYSVYVRFSQTLILASNNLNNYSTDTTNSYALFLHSIDYALAINNIMVNAHGGVPFFQNNYSPLCLADYNAYYSPFGAISKFQGNTYYSIASLIAAGRDSNSLFVNPIFYGNNNLHVNAVQLNAMAQPMWFVSKDIDGENRDTTPDIGADEFVPAKVDVGVLAFVNPKDQIKPQSTAIKVAVFNFGIDTVTSFKVRAIVNRDTLNLITVTDTLSPGDSVHVVIGNYTFKRDSVNNLKAWTSDPNGTADAKNSNDTLTMLNKKTAMSGVYTIGGSAPNFNTFNEAVAALISDGTADTVIFKVRNGNYSEHIRIPSITGASATKPIVFESENMDSSAVVLSYSATQFDSNYVVYLDGASYFIFRHLTLRADGTSFSRVLRIENSASYNNFNNNKIESSVFNNTSTYRALVVSDDYGKLENYNTFSKNIFYGGSYGIYWSGNGVYPNYYEDGNRILNNRFINQYYNGIYSENQHDFHISKNYIESNSVYSYFYCIYASSNSINIRIDGNQLIRTAGGGYGIYIYGDNSNDTSIVANNMISLTGNVCYGIYAYYTSKYLIAHNNINIVSTNNSSMPLYMSSASNARVLNNILVTNSQLVFQLFGSSYTINANNYLNSSSSSTFCDYLGNSYASYAGYVAANTQDSNSINIDPAFKSPTDLHVKATDLNGAAIILAEINTDFDGETRDTISPDIGADEFIPPPTDAGISHIVLPNIPFAADTQWVKVALKNYGTNILYTANIDWELNGVAQSTHYFNSSLNFGDTVHLTLGKFYFHPDSAYNMTCWSSLPNGISDTINDNDTSKVNNQYPALRGVYTIGGATPDFNTFTEAIDALKRGGMIDSVIFKVRSGTYTEQLHIPKIVGANRNESITFESENGDSSSVILTYAGHSFSDNHIIHLEGTQGVVLKKITISGGNATYASIIKMTKGVKHINITNCQISGYAYTTSSNHYVIRVIPDGVANNAHISIRNNAIKFGSIGVYLYGYLSGNYDNNINIIGNQISPYYQGINANYLDTCVIAQNHITDNGYSSFYGVDAYQLRNLQVNRNFMELSSGYYGIYLSSCYGNSSQYNLVSNNMVYLGSNGNSNGIYLSSCSYLKLYNNNINHLSTNTSSYACRINSGNNIRSFNNIFKANSGYALYTNSSSNISHSDHNNYFTSGSNFVYWASSASDLASLKSVNNKDTNSMSLDPLYVSNSNLHVRAVQLNEKAEILPEITVDFDGELRDTLAPDIGADEFAIPAANDAGISAFGGPLPAFAQGNQTVRVVITNFGSDSLKNANIHWTMNGVSQTAFSWTGNLAVGQSDTASLGTFNFIRGTGYTLQSWTTQPNGQTDSIHYNDTLTRNNLYAGLSGTYTVGGTLPDFNTLNEAVNILHLAGVVDTVTFAIRNGTYYERVSLMRYPGSSAARPVIFTSESGDSSKVIFATAHSYNTNFVFNLSNADNIKIRKLTFAPSNYYYKNCITFNGGTDNLEISNCEFKNGSNYYSTYAIYSNGDQDLNTLISGNLISSYSYGIIIQGNNTSTSTYEDGLIIRKNRFVDIGSSDIYLYYNKNFKVEGNSFENTGNSNRNVVVSYFSTENAAISHNKLIGSFNLGILLYNHVGTSSKLGQIFNNFISCSNSNPRGIELRYCDYVNVDFNSLNLHHASNTGITIYNLSSTNTKLRNNIISNKGNGHLLYFDNSTPAVSDYNNLYAVGTKFIYYAGAERSSLSNWQSVSSKDANSVSFDPRFYSDTDLHTDHVNLDSAGIPISGITDDIEGDARNTANPDIGADEFNSLPNNLGVTTIHMTSGCQLDSQIVKCTVFNFGNLKQANYTIKYAVNGTFQDSILITDTLLSGQSKMVQFPTKYWVGNIANYAFSIWSDLTTEQYRNNDTASKIVSNYANVSQVGTMLPADSTKNVDFPFTLSWTPASGATTYDVYIWADSISTRPSSPTFANTAQISKQVASGLGYGIMYKWQVVSKNPGCYTDGPIQRFTIKELPDISITTVSAPTTAFSGNIISVSWVVKNIGSGTTGSTNWYDYVYLSQDKLWDGSDIYLGGNINSASLNAGQSYSNSANLSLPNGINGKYYFIVRSDINNNLLESNEGNNIRSDSAGTQISLTPPPDLQVVSITKPSVVFSGSNIPFSYTVKNKGSGNTVATNWYDYVYLSSDTVFSGSAKFVKSIFRTGKLDPDSQYVNSSTLTIPITASGNYYIYVVTDATNRVYEHTNENNNRRRSDSIIVKLTPPPDLYVEHINSPDSASNNEQVVVRYAVKNIGGTSTSNRFTDAIYYSTAPVYSPTTATYLTGASTHSNIANGDSIEKTISLRMPKNLNGLVYFFMFIDLHDNVFEGNNDSNNTKRFGITLLSPNLKVPELICPTQDSSGKAVTLHWKVTNMGPGKDINQARRDVIYFSKKSTFHRDSAMRLDSVHYTTNIGVNDTISKSYITRIPNGTQGLMYFYVETDAGLSVFENGLDSNNISSGAAITVILSPYPDLHPTVISAPDSNVAGGLVKIKYTIKNSGTFQANPQWKDRVYLSKDSVFDLSKCIVLGTQTKVNTVAKNTDYTDSQLVTIPGTVSAGDYYVYLFTEVDNVLYEHQTEGNNIKRSDKFYIDGYPPIDLKVMQITKPDSVFSGNSASISWVVKNIGQAVTLADFWQDRVYLSTDSIFDYSDDFLGEVQVNEDIQPDSSYQINSNFTVPNGKNGFYYVIVVTDYNKNNVDDDTTNNKLTAKNTVGAASPIKIILTASPDLKITSWEVPSTATGGQPVTIKWTVKNDGIGNTTAGSWVDKVFLSTDYVLDNSDILLGSKTRIGNLNASNSYTDSANYFVPLTSGNYIVIIATDETNRVYEHQAEHNNTAASVITVGAAPPADLIVSSVTAPSSVNSGSDLHVSYVLKNQGANPVNGFWRDNVYLSKDQVWDASDILFKTIENSGTILPNNTRTINTIGVVKGVSMGQYYVVVYTDIRNNINESADTNNTAFSNTLDVSVPLLPLHTLVVDTLKSTKEIYYRIEIPDSLNGESILVQLKGDSINGNNELYVRFGDVPSRSQFDFGFSEPFKGNQEIIIPEVSVGTYYVMATGTSTSITNQPVSLYARKLEFEIRKVSPVSGGNIGDVTVKIQGSKFTEGTTFFLANDSLLIKTEEPDSLGRMYSQSTNSAKNVDIIDPTVAYVTFRLEGKPIGVYDVSALKNIDEIATLDSGFRIESGIPPDIQLNVIRPSNTRTNSIIYFEVHFTNEGNIDLKDSKLEIVSNGGAAISFSPAGLSQNLTKLDIILEDTEGLSGVLRPKGTGKAIIYTNSSTALGFNILMPE